MNHILARYGSFIAILTVTGCASGMREAASNTGLPPQIQGAVDRGSGGLIQHVVIVIQENRTFDNFFSTFPGADGTRKGQMSDGQWVKLTPTNLVSKHDFGHRYQAYLRDYDGGKMDGFDLEGWNHRNAGKHDYVYVNPSQIKPYWIIAKRYVLGDHMFQTQGSGSFTAHQDLIAGGTAIGPTKSMIDYPTGNPWGCDATPGTVTTLITLRNRYLLDKGPFPCLTYRTLRDLLDAKGLSWRYYTPHGRGLENGDYGWNAFQAIAAVRNGPEWSTNISMPEKNVLQDALNGTLANVSWVVPDGQNSDHPGGAKLDTGPSWVAQVVNAIGSGPDWPSTAIVVVWDDWGGLYDHVPPPQLGFGGLGFRVPMLVVSPYARKGYISHTQYEFGSILRFIENNWHLGRLGTTDVRARGIGDVFDFTQPPRTFKPIPAKYSRSFFEHQPPSGIPVDTE